MRAMNAGAQGGACCAFCSCATTACDMAVRRPKWIDTHHSTPVQLVLRMCNTSLACVMHDTPGWVQPIPHSELVSTEKVGRGKARTPLLVSGLTRSSLLECRSPGGGAEALSHAPCGRSGLDFSGGRSQCIAVPPARGHEHRTDVIDGLHQSCAPG
jgi:hypothetical protein